MPVVKKRTAKKPVKRTIKAKRTTGKTGGVLDRIAPVEFDPHMGLKFNLYGRSGTGKTTLWSTFPKPILAIVFGSINDPGELLSVADVDGIDQVTPTSTGELLEVLDYLHNGDHEYRTGVLDHATGLQDYVLKEILDLDELPVAKYRIAGKGEAWGIASQQDWGQCSIQMKTLLRKTLGLPINVVIVAQEREFNTDQERDDLSPYVGSALTPSVTGWLNPACNYIVQTFIRQKMVTKHVKVGKKTVEKQAKVPNQVEYCLRVGPHSIYTTKFRKPKTRRLPDVIVDPDYDKILEVIKGE